MIENSRKVTYKPLKFVIIYIAVTLLLVFIGPIEYYEFYYRDMLIFMAFVILAIALGYVSAGRKYNKKQKSNLLKNEKYFVKESTIDSIIVIALIIALIFEVLTFFSYTNTLSELSLQSLLDRIKNIGDVYRSSLAAAREETDVNKLRKLITFFGIIKQVAIVGYLFRSKYLRKYRAVFWITIAFTIINILAFKGTQKEIGDLFIYIFSIILIKNTLNKNLNLYRYGIPIGILCVLILGFIQLSRANTYGISRSGFQSSFFKYDESHIVYKVFGQNIGYAISSVIYYVSGGYYGLTKSLTVPFRWTYGVGNSFALSSYAAQYLGMENMITYSIPSRAEGLTGYPALMYWSTIFPWLASDLSYPGTIVFMFWISRVYSITWREAVYNGNFLSVLLFTRLNILWLFVPANNQLMQTRESTITTIMLFILWVLFHNRCNRVNSNMEEQK